MKGNSMDTDLTRRTFLGVIAASAAGVLTGALQKIVAAASTGKSGETFLLGGDLLVNRLGFGAMRLTGEGIWGWPPDRELAKQVLRRAVELGVNFIDTAAFHRMWAAPQRPRMRGIFEFCILTLGHSLESLRGRISPPRRTAMQVRLGPTYPRAARA